MAYIYNFEEGLKNNLAQIQADSYISVSDQNASSKEISEFLKNCKSVRRLTISHQTIRELPDLSFIPDLYNLELICPEIRDFPKAHFNEGIMSLSVTKGKFKELPDFIWQSEKMNTLRFDYSELEKIIVPENSQVQFLNITNAFNLTDILFVKNQPKLQQLFVSSSSLISLDKSFENAENLCEITVQAPIERVHCEFRKLSKFRNITASCWNMEEYSFIENLPINFGSLSIKEPLKEWRNLPDLNRFESIYGLNLEGCLDKSLAAEPLKVRINNHLYLSHCKFENVPQIITNSINIKTIEFIDSPPVSFGDCMKYLPNTLNWYFNDTNLIDLDLLPNEDLEWKHLRISLESFQFENLDFLDKMPKLKSLHIGENTLPSTAVLLREKTVPLDNQTKSIPNLKFKNVKQFCSLCSAIAKSGLTQEDQEYLADYFSKKRKIEVNKTWNWEQILKFSNVTQPSFRKQLQTLIEAKIAENKPENALSPNSVIYITGKPKLKKTEIKKTIQELGMTLVSKYSDKVTHIIIGTKSPDAALLADKNFVPIADSDLQKYFSNEQPQYLTESAGTEEGEEMFENLNRLLTSSDVSNVLVALEMIKAGGTPPQIFEGLLVVQKTTDNAKIRKITKELLEVHAPAEWKPIVRDRISLKSIKKGKSEIEIRRQFKTLAKRVPPALAGKFSCFIYKHTGHGLRYALTARLAKDIKKEAYQLLIRDGHFDLSKGLGFTPKPKFGEVDNYYAPPESAVNVPTLPLELGTITSLNLSNCRYLQVRKELAAYQDLKHLDISDNYYSSLGDTLKSLQNLETINLSKNRLNRFPEVLLEMPNLKRIDLRENKFEEIPKAFKNSHPDCEVLI